MSIIKIGDPIEQDLLVEEPPADDLWVQANQLDRTESFQVYILRETHQQIWKQLKASPHIECGGVLVGYPFRSTDQRTMFVVIAGFIPQKASNSSVVHFTVGPEQTAEARDQLATKYSGLLIVGWYHSHPGHGVFLSEQDMTIVRSIYNSDWHIALVIDPQRGQEGFFVGGQGIKLTNKSWVEIKLLPTFVKAVILYNRYEDLIALGQVGLAQREAQRLSQLIAGSPELAHWRSRGTSETNLQRLDEVVTTEANDREILYQESVKYANLGDWTNAKRYLELYIASDPLMRRTFDAFENATRNLEEFSKRSGTRNRSRDEKRVSVLRWVFLVVYGLLLLGTLLISSLNSVSYTDRLVALGWALLVNLVAASSVVLSPLSHSSVDVARVENENTQKGIIMDDKWLLRGLILTLIALSSVTVTVWIVILLGKP